MGLRTPFAVAGFKNELELGDTYDSEAVRPQRIAFCSLDFLSLDPKVLPLGPYVIPGLCPLV